ncbi:MAG: hypothetical protein DMG09_07705 [Acidobacteria bacterium]|nr:MAG: hypothetical protein DMG09_07705 [Acidobacteriota bacterium]
MLTDGAGRALLTGKQEASGDQHHKRDPGQNRFGSHVFEPANHNHNQNSTKPQMNTDAHGSVFIGGLHFVQFKQVIARSMS